MDASLLQELSDDEDDGADDGDVEEAPTKKFKFSKEDKEHPAARVSKLKAEAKSHKKELDELKEKDPEFYKFLQENDEGLLDFEDDEEAEETEGEDEGEDEKEADKGKKKLPVASTAAASEEGARSVSLQDVSKLAREAGLSQSLDPLRQLVRAFESAVHVQDDDYGARSGVVLG